MHVASIVAALAAASCLVEANPVHQRMRRGRVTSAQKDISQSSVTTTSCSYTEKANPAGILHCGVYGTLDPKLIVLISNIKRNTYGDCRDACINDATCISFGYNATSSNCASYGKNLVSPHPGWPGGCMLIIIIPGTNGIEGQQGS